MFVSIRMAMFIFNDILLIALKKASDKYSSSKCRSSCCEGVLNWNYKVNRKSQTMESMLSNES